MIDDLTSEEILQTFYNITRPEINLTVTLLNRCRELGLTDTVKNENILPRPVVRDGNGKLIKDHTPRDFYLKLQEEIFESFKENFEWFLHRQRNMKTKEASARNRFAEEIADVITVCISLLEALGYDEKGRSEIFRKVNEKNEKRGYFRNA